MAIQAYNYANPQKVTPISGGKIAPFTYAATPAPVAPSAPATPSFLDRAVSVGNNVIKAATQAPAPKSLDMQDSLSAGWDTISSTVQDLAKRITDAGATLNSNAPILDKVTSEGNVALGLVNTAFLGVTAPLIAARGIPVVGYVADAVNNFFGVLSAGGAGYADTAVDSLPFSDATKAKIRPLAEQVGALIAQTKAGDLVHSKATELVTKSKALTEVIHTGIQDAKATIEKTSVGGDPAQAKVAPFDYTKTPAEVHADYAKSQGYEPYTPHESLPTIDAGPSARETLPTIQAEPKPSTKLGDLTIEPIKEPIKQPVQAPAPEAPTAPTEIPQETPEITPIKSEAAAPEGQTPSGVAKSIEAKAIEANLTKGFKDVAGYDASTIKEQAQLFSESAAKGPEEILAQIKGDKPLPEGQKSAPFVVAAEKYIKDNPEIARQYDLPYELGKSPHTSSFSESASNLGLSQNRVQDSATAKIQEIRKARETRNNVTSQHSHVIRKRVVEATQGVNLGKEDLGKIQSFIDSLVC